MARGTKRSRNAARFDGMPQARPSLLDFAQATQAPKKAAINNEGRLNSQREDLNTLERPARVPSKSNVFEAACQNLGQFLTRNGPRSSAAPTRGEFGSESSPSSKLRLLRLGSSVEFLSVVQSITPGKSHDKKTFGTIREKDAPTLLMSSMSGWTSPGQNSELLDSESWTTAVHQICDLIGHVLPQHGYDSAISGNYQACHVEKRLILYFICHYLADGKTGLLDAKKFKDLQQRRSPLEAVLTLDKKPCKDCIEFRDKMEQLTGIVFRIEYCMEVGETETYRESTRIVRSRLKEYSCTRKEKNTSRIAKPATRGRGRPRKHHNPTDAIEVDISITMKRNPNISVVIPALIRQKTIPRAVSPPTTPRRPQQPQIVPMTPPRTPRKATRGSGLFTPPSEPFSFEELDRVNRKKQYCRKGSFHNPLVLR